MDEDQKRPGLAKSDAVKLPVCGPSKKGNINGGNNLLPFKLLVPLLWYGCKSE